VVDDEPSVREVARMMLVASGYEVLTANDGVEALEVYRENRERVAVVLLDMTLPRMSGEQVFRELRRLDPQARVLLSSGYSAGEILARVDGASAADFIQKPYRLEVLEARVRRLCGDPAAGIS
jgi:two-component system cell cycle sensor histidine kinase/response regulator CckA